MVKVIKIILATFFIIASFIFFLHMQRERDNWKENIEFIKDTFINVDFMRSSKKYYGSHVMGFGGGDHKNSFKFKYNEVEYFHKTPFTPLVMKLYKEQFYIIYFDRTDINKVRFQFFKSLKDGSFEKIKPELFPKSIAIQNRWFQKKINDKSDFASSLTAKIWQELTTNKPYYESDFFVPKELLNDYKEKYIVNKKE